MQNHQLQVILSAAATALIVAAALGAIARRRPGSSWLNAVALLAALVPSTRIILGAWPSLPPTQAVEWTLLVAAVAAIIPALTILPPFRTLPAWCIGGAAGAGAGLVVVFFQVSRALERMPAPSRIAWSVAIPAAMCALGAIVAAVFTRSHPAPPESVSILSRLRDRHWPTLALGLAFAASAPSILFATSTMKLFEHMAALACALAGLALVAWLICTRLGLAGAAVVGVAVYSSLWLVGHFYGQQPRPLALALAAMAPCMLLLGLHGPLARRAGWVRLAVVCACAVALAAAPAALYGPAYLEGLREMT